MKLVFRRHGGSNSELEVYTQLWIKHWGYSAMPNLEPESSQVPSSGHFVPLSPKNEDRDGFRNHSHIAQ